MNHSLGIMRDFLIRIYNAFEHKNHNQIGLKLTTYTYLH